MRFRARRGRFPPCTGAKRDRGRQILERRRDDARGVVMHCTERPVHQGWKLKVETAGSDSPQLAWCLASDGGRGRPRGRARGFNLRSPPSRGSDQPAARCPASEMSRRGAACESVRPAGAALLRVAVRLGLSGKLHAPVAAALVVAGARRHEGQARLRNEASATRRLGIPSIGLSPGSGQCQG